MGESIRGLKRTHHCGDLRKDNVGEEVTIMGWVQRRRDLGGLIFIDLRDRSGLVQVVFNPEDNQEVFTKAEKLRSEYVVAIEGQVQERPQKNPNLATGEIEVHAKYLRILDEAKTPPIYIQDDLDVNEDLRLKYRYLDLRRPVMQKNLILRHRVTMLVRKYLDRMGFLEIETPILTRSTPEGARDYLVPSRVHPGKFFALPQSPQIFKQILMASGLERYFQIARCFRDEDLRADRQPEFTQIDIEMSFVTQEDVMEMMEEMIIEVFSGVGLSVFHPFPRMTYDDAMNYYGSDKPDIRFDMKLVDISHLVKDVDFKVFANTVKNGGQVKGIRVEGCANFSRKEIDELTKYVAIYGAKGLAWIALKEDGIKSPIAKFFKEEELDAIIKEMGGKTGDLLLFVADSPQVVAASLGALRLKLGKELGLIPEDKFQFVWITDFPLVEYDEEEGRYVSLHHPFTHPVEEDIPLLETDPLKVRAQAYDLVLNGVELGGGSIRIHNSELQRKVFKMLSLTEEEINDKFGFLLEAFQYGTPPHGGIAFGLDRMVMLMAGCDTIRDVIAFPKTASATDLMTNAPSDVSKEQLDELHINLQK
ncbi:aspartate--tRNA ligase [Anoxybacter fermentans]|uniref:Aspartate--tRNA ligase n=1 Tax=Anoxybacter fermentans TaxID=1323375 RepID=A0A3S9SXK5_9FIRM|nr:aspartate--tRNA ligase [Anoxybacter fermentans]AZR73086.1 aspartate--tRNA ligase [Anoxybacter fermentans]